MNEVAERISLLEGKVSEFDNLFNMIFEEIRDTKALIDKRIDETNRRINELKSDTNKRIDETNKRIDETNKRIDETNRRIEELRSDTNKRIDETNKKIDDLFKWMIGFQAATLITIITMWVTLTLKLS
ncbi:MAG: coiled-coil domain-containing protein [Methanosarcinales archaeon]